MGGRQRDAQPRRALGHRGRADGGHPQAALAQAFHHGQRRGVGADDQGLHGGARRQQLPAGARQQRRQAGAQLGNALGQGLAALVLGLDQGHAGLQRAGQHGRCGGGEDVAARLLQQPFDEHVAARDKGTRHACGLAQRGHVEHAWRGICARESGLGQAAPALGAEHAEAVGVIEQQQRVVLLAQRQQAADVGHVAVHAEHGIADDQLAPGRAGGQLRGQVGQVGMGIAVDLGARQARTVDQAGVVERIGKQGIASTHQGRHDAGIGGVARIEVERTRQLHEVRQLFLQRGVDRAVAADQGRAARAHAKGLGTRAGGAHQGGVSCQAQVVVAAKGQHGVAVHLHVGAAGGALQRRRGAAAAAQVGCVELGDARGNVVQPGAAHCHSSGRV